MTVPAIPMPEILDPDRPASDASGDSPVTDDEQGDPRANALKATCTYGQRLWHTLDAMRAYLVSSLPASTATVNAGIAANGATTPTGPDDDEGWARWQEAYSAITSLLAGPHGDSGFGHHEARRLAQVERSWGKRVLSSLTDQPSSESGVRKLDDEPRPAGHTAASEQTQHNGPRSDQVLLQTAAPKGRSVGRVLPLIAAVLLGFLGRHLLSGRQPARS